MWLNLLVNVSLIFYVVEAVLLVVAFFIVGIKRSKPVLGFIALFLLPVIPVVVLVITLILVCKDLLNEDKI